ncbi:nucleoside-diphosphate kinase [Candidatus Acetothermia bacterium]|nr:nucleoside-diphosphate kinase [Candidatus Acetothermia bacterium]
MVNEKTFVMLKPDAVERRLVGELISRLEKKNLRIIAARLIRIDKKLAETHYTELKEKPFFKELVKFVTDGPALAMVVQGPNAISVVRAMMGATNPFNATPGTIRGDYGLDLTKNLIHGSDGPESAKREVALFFKESEMVG